jgi:hypothetical protein
VVVAVIVSIGKGEGEINYVGCVYLKDAYVVAVDARRC